MSDKWGSYECPGKEGYEQPKLRTRRASDLNQMVAPYRDIQRTIRKQPTGRGFKYVAQALRRSPQIRRRRRRRRLEKLVQDKKTTLTNTANKVDFCFKLFNLVLRSMDSLAHLMLNATNYILLRLSLFSGSFLKLGLGKRKQCEICSKRFLFQQRKR